MITADSFIFVGMKFRGFATRENFPWHFNCVVNCVL